MLLFGIDVVYIFLVMSVFMVAGLAYFYLNSQYPIVRFIVFKGGIIYPDERRRLMGKSKLVPDNLFYIILHGRTIIGEDLNDFDQVEIVRRGGLFGLGGSSSRVCLATECAGRVFPVSVEDAPAVREIHAYLKDTHLVPMTYDKSKTLDFKEVGAAVDMASGFINNIEQNMELLKKREPLLEMLFAIIPVILPILVILVGMYFIMQATINGIQQTEKLVVELAKAIKSGDFTGVDAQVNAMDAESNETIQGNIGKTISSGISK